MFNKLSMFSFGISVYLDYQYEINVNVRVSKQQHGESVNRQRMFHYNSNN